MAILTILDYKGGYFTLGFPDDEVWQDFSSLMSGLIADKDTYRAVGKSVWAVGLSFNGKTRQFVAGLAEPVK